MPVYALGEVQPNIHPDAFVHPQAVIIGKVVVGAESSIWPGAVLRGDGAGITVGERTSIQDNVVLHNTMYDCTQVGNDVTVGHLAHLEGCIVEDEALIGVSSVVLPKAVVGKGALVAACAVVTNSMEVPSLALALGIPAKIREGHMQEGSNLHNARGYVERGYMYRSEMRELDPKELGIWQPPTC
ncbi:MAG: gamma carbonic anhydrase family protein [Acidimicrobiia bacterium]|nr:gamma carbonic anhydrase family protein [Acidimicrobiia bacterium]